MTNKQHLIIDFDSTFVSLEALDELARIALRSNVHREAIVAKIARITYDGMEGKIGFGESLLQRLTLFNPSQQHIDELVLLLKQRVTRSIMEHQNFLKANATNIYIISGGFREYIVPVVREYGIAADHVLANTFVLDQAGTVTGCDQNNPLSRDGGKVEALKALELDGYVVMVGDGYSDFQTRESGVADEFIAFVENVERKSVVEHADHVAAGFDEVIKLVELPDTIAV